MKQALVGLLLALAPLSFGQMTDKEKQWLEDTLYVANLAPADLATERSQFPGLPMLGLIRSGLNDPVNTADRLMALHGGSFNELPSATLAGMFREVAPSGTPGGAPAPAQATSSSLPPKTAAAVQELAAAVLHADAEIRAAVAQLSPAEFRTVVESLAVVGAEEPKVKFSFVKGNTVGWPQLASLLARVDLPRIWAAGLAVQAATERAYTQLKDANEPVTGKIRLQIGGLPVVVAGQGNDPHDEVDARITIDLGGDDTYTGRHAAGIGYSSVLVDVDGNDHYDVPDLSLGVGVMGVGCALDGGGSDNVETASLSLGAGLGGVGVFYKRGGHDTYRSSVLCQGFGFQGMGLLVDTAGDDVYRAKLLAQGAGRTDGFGWLVDKQGRDIYEAGGLSVNAPLFEDVHYSFAQGFGNGFREDSGGSAGGIGLLTDHQGDDHYLGETYCQAASYWYSLGSLYDVRGNDSYTAHHYAQASAMHLTSAFLFDLAGHDAYLVKYGAAQAIGHDYGVAWLFERSGGDIYASRDARPGTGVANGLGVCLDFAGDDTYTSSPAFGREDRSMPSMGVFLDAGGSDRYPEGMKDGWATVAASWGLGMDSGGADSVTGGQPQTVPDPPVGSAPMRSPSEMESLYAKATQWGVGTAQAEVEQSVRDLIAIGLPAWEWMLENHLKDANRLHVRAYVRVARALGQAGVAPLGAKALRASDAELSIVLRIATDAGITDVGAILPGIIKNKPALRLQAVRAVGVLKAAGAVDALLPLLIEKDPVLVRAAMVSLSLVDDRAALGTASSMLNSDDPVVREMAVRIIVKSPEQGFAIAKTLVADADERKARLGLQAMARINMYNGLQEIAKSLTDPRPGMRISALLLLDGKCPPESKEAFEALKQDPIPTVRAVAAKAKP